MYTYVFINLRTFEDEINLTVLKCEKPGNKKRQFRSAKH